MGRSLPAERISGRLKSQGVGLDASGENFSVLRTLAWQYRALRRHRGPDRHRVFLALALEAERLRVCGVAEGELHEVLYYLLQQSP